MTWSVVQGDCLDVMRGMETASVNCCVTSPPYWGLRDYGTDGQIGLEQTLEEYVTHVVVVFREVRRLLRDDGTVWLNMGDTYSGSTMTGGKGWNAQGGENGYKQRRQFSKSITSTLRPKQLFGIPWRVAFALQSDGWFLRQDIIWHKPNPMPESARDRCTKAHEYIFLLAKSARYWCDMKAIREPAAYSGQPRKKDSFARSAPVPPGQKPQHRVDRADIAYIGSRNRRSVWTVASRPFKGSHFATFPPDLIEPCILAGCPVGGTVLDPFNGTGTTGVVAVKHRRNYIGIEINTEYVEMARGRIHAATLGQMELIP